MPLKDRFRRLRRGSVSADTSPRSPATPAAVASPETGRSTGDVTPAATQTPVAAAGSSSYSDLTTIGDVLVQQATNGTVINSDNSEKTKKKKRHRVGLFRRHHKDDPYADWPEDVYRPHEVPPPKYKRTPDPAHMENLSAFSFGGAMQKLTRRASEHSGVSPGGSKWVSPFASRAGSRAGSRAPSMLADPSGPSQSTSQAGSVAEEADGNAGRHVAGGAAAGREGGGGLGGSPMRKPAQGTRGPSRQGFVHGQPIHLHDVARVAEEGEAEEREEKTEKDAASISQPLTAKDGEGDRGKLARAHSMSSHDMPFTEQELTQALSRATLQPDRRKLFDVTAS